MPAITKSFSELLAARPEVELAVLFGSAAREKLTKSSDVDIGLRMKRVDPVDLRRMEADLERSVGRTLDVIDLDSAPPQLRFEIARDGILLVERTAGLWTAFRARAFVDWWDFGPIARMIHRAAIARLREGRTDGPR